MQSSAEHFTWPLTVQKAGSGSIVTETTWVKIGKPDWTRSSLTTSFDQTIRRSKGKNYISTDKATVVYGLSQGDVSLVSRQTRDVNPVSVYCWASVYDAGPTLNTPCVNVS